MVWREQLQSLPVAASLPPGLQRPVLPLLSLPPLLSCQDRCGDYRLGFQEEQPKGRGDFRLTL